MQLPVDEIVFIPSLPVRVEELTRLSEGRQPGSSCRSRTINLAIDAALTARVAPLVKPGMKVAIDEQALGMKANGVVESVASTPGTRGVDGYHIYFEIRVLETSFDRSTVFHCVSRYPSSRQKAAVTAVPVSALSLAADGTSRMQIAKRRGRTRIRRWSSPGSPPTATSQ